MDPHIVVPTWSYPSFYGTRLGIVIFYEMTHLPPTTYNQNDFIREQMVYPPHFVLQNGGS